MEGAPLSGFLPVSHGFPVLSPACSPQRRLLASEGLAELQAGRAARCLQKRWDVLAFGRRVCSRARVPFPATCPAPAGPWHWLPTAVCTPVCGPFPVARVPPAGALEAVTDSGSGAYGALVTSGSLGGAAGPDLWEVSTVLACRVCSSWASSRGSAVLPLAWGGSCPWPRLTPAPATPGTRCSC